MRALSPAPPGRAPELIPGRRRDVPSSRSALPSPVTRFAPEESRRAVATSDHRTLPAERSEQLPGASFPDDVVSMLRLALDGLPGRQQSAIRMAMVERLAVPDIAARLGISSAEVMDAMRDGLTTLRDVLAVVDPDTAALGQASGSDGAHT